MESSKIVLWFYVGSKKNLFIDTRIPFSSHTVEISNPIYIKSEQNGNGTEYNGNRCIDFSGLDSTKPRMKANKQTQQQTRKSSSFHVSTKQSSWWSFSPIFYSILYDFLIYFSFSSF